MKAILIIVFIFAGLQASSQKETKVYPTHWWTGMKNSRLQLLLRSEQGLPAQATIRYPGVKLVKVYQPSNKHYLIIDLQISASAKPGKFDIRLGDDKISYELKQREPGRGTKRNRGIGSEDLVYLIMPDRFSNGDPSNDRFDGMKDQTLNRDSIFHRHGGDLKGVENHLDYLDDLGVTAVWMMPVIKNDMPERSEHGYAFTDHYTVEPRLGGEKAYKDLVTALHNRGMKIIQDAVYNHTGREHFLFRDLPDSSWFHFWPNYTNTNYREQALMDPHASDIDEKVVSDGWFVPQMPDVNQRNPYFANFLIQHAIWTTEEFGLDGWRIDTYIYNDLEFMNKCNKALLDEFPKIHLFGETWVHGVLNQAYFVKNKLNAPFKSNLPGVTDFQTNLYGIEPALNQAPGWTEGVNRLHQTAANDFIYVDPMKNVIFLDNHDKSRFYSVVGENTQKLKMGIAWLMTYRGIPQLYYGTEIGMKGISNPDGWVRLDFPGGWEGDPSNKFTESGRTEVENEIFNYTRSLARFRKSSSAITKGKMMHFVPDNGVYVYFRYDDKETIMCIMNTNEGETSVNPERYKEKLSGFTRALDVVTGNETDLKQLAIPGRTVSVLKLK